MPKLINAVYEKGVLKLVRPSDVSGLKEHEEIKLMIIPKEDAVFKSKGVFKVNSDILKEVAENEELLYED